MFKHVNQVMNVYTMIPIFLCLQRYKKATKNSMSIVCRDGWQNIGVFLCVCTVLYFPLEACISFMFTKNFTSHIDCFAPFDCHVTNLKILWFKKKEVIYDLSPLNHTIR